MLLIKYKHNTETYVKEYSILFNREQILGYTIKYKKSNVI